MLTVIIIRETQIKTTTRHYLTSIRMVITKKKKKKKTRVGQNVEKLESFDAAVGNAKWCRCFGKQYGVSLKN